MTTSAVFADQLTYTAPGDTEVVEVSTSTSPYTASAVGFISVPDGTAGATVYDVPVADITKIQSFKIKNTLSLDIGIRFNGAGADEFQLSPGCEIKMSQPVESTANDLTAISVVTTDTQDGDGTIEYHVFGTST